MGVHVKGINQRFRILARKPQATSFERVLMLTREYTPHLSGEYPVYFHANEMSIIVKALEYYHKYGKGKL